jgi:hypothetical protein
MEASFLETLYDTKGSSPLVGHQCCESLIVSVGSLFLFFSSSNFLVVCILNGQTCSAHYDAAEARFN